MKIAEIEIVQRSRPKGGRTPDSCLQDKGGRWKWRKKF